MTDIEKIKKTLKTKPSPKKLSSGELLSSGSTLLNLACSGRVFGAFPKGHYVHLVGDSSSGKTFLSLTCFAEATINPSFVDYRFIHDNAEDGALMDLTKFFGKKTAEKIEPPKWDKEGSPVYSTTVEEFYYHVSDAIAKKEPFIYVTDSLDALTSGAEQKKFKQQKKAHREGEKVAGSYGDGKAKTNSSGIRSLLPGLKRTGSILIIISQTRDNIGFGSMFDPKTHSGGRALKFYATLQMWSAVKTKIKRNIAGKKRQLGIMCSIAVKKNRLTGRERTITIPISHSYGIDDISSCINYLIDENHWSGSDGRVSAPEFDFEGTHSKLIKLIEERREERKLRLIVGKVWNAIEEACQTARKPRYE